MADDFMTKNHWEPVKLVRQTAGELVYRLPRGNGYAYLGFAGSLVWMLFTSVILFPDSWGGTSRGDTSFHNRIILGGVFCSLGLGLFAITGTLAFGRRTLRLTKDQLNLQLRVGPFQKHWEIPFSQLESIRVAEIYT